MVDNCVPGVYNGLMFPLDTPFRIVYLAVTAALAAALTAGFIVRVCASSRVRKKTDVLFITLDVVFAVLTLVTGLFMLAAAYSPFGFSVTDADGALRFAFGAKTLFSIPGAGFLAADIIGLRVVGQSFPFVLVALAVLCLAALLVKTRRNRKAEPVEAETLGREKPEAEKSEPLGREKPETEKSEPLGREKPETDAQTDAQGIGLGAEPKKAATAEAETLGKVKTQTDPGAENARELLGEIDRLVSAADETLDPADRETAATSDGDVRERLRRAIAEGLALAREPEEADFSETCEAEPVAREAVQKNGEPIETSFEAQPGSADYERVLQQAKMRTIIRRPPAKSVLDLTRRAQEVEQTDAEANADPPDAPAVPGVSAPPPDAQRKKALTEPEEPLRPETETPTAKVVSPIEGALPLTKRHMILNRRCAANVFGEYLKQKQDDERGELTEALSTIILQ